MAGHGLKTTSWHKPRASEALLPATGLMGHLSLCLGKQHAHGAARHPSFKCLLSLSSSGFCGAPGFLRVFHKTLGKGIQIQRHSLCGCTGRGKTQLGALASVARKDGRMPCRDQRWEALVSHLRFAKQTPLCHSEHLPTKTANLIMLHNSV